ncbi:MAG: choice-of-anchor J domain-containing protein [Candidatus Neomarinimicrobiota bacterium]
MQQDTLNHFSLEISNDGEEGSILNFRFKVGMEYLFYETFEQGELPIGWYDTTNAVDCDEPGWFISEDASSSYFEIPDGDGFYIATNDDACNSDGSNDILYTGEIDLPDGMVELSFDRFFKTGFGQTFHILLSTNSWENSTEIFTLGHLDGNEEWVSESVDLSEFKRQTIELGFKSDDNGQWASGVVLDNIAIGVTPLWISTNSNGYLDYLGSEELDFSINTNGMQLGVYQGLILVENIQIMEVDIIHLHLTIGEPTAMIGEENLPNNFQLYQNYPNPFNPQTNIRFSIPLKQDVSLVIFDVVGRVVRKVNMDGFVAGNHIIKWNGRNQNGYLVSAEIYFYRLSTPSFSMTKKMILLK